MAKNAGHIIDLNLIPKDDLIQACINSTAYGDDSQLEISLLNVYKG